MHWPSGSHGPKLFFVLGAVVHCVLVFCIFDIYYSSPIVHGARPHAFRPSESVAKRLVVFSADGLRSRSFFGHPEKSPYLHSLIRGSKSAWGISTSHVPTESRPGHVALMAGIYEDVSAVTRGWSKNPVSFDSVFNRSRQSFLFGSPDIVPMFAENVPTAKASCYSAAEEDFSRQDSSALDLWVFDKALLHRTDERVSADQTLFFLHLLGLDTNGHGHKPHSRQYVDNIRVVDEGIRRTVELFERRFPDNKTAFLFTADHGMTDWGSHGAGTEDEILTPFVLWGQGVRGQAARERVQQVDLAPLQAALLGVPIPVNSLGVLPLGFLDFSARHKCDAACTNLKQMVEQFGIKRAEKEANSFAPLFKEYPGFKAAVLNKVHAAVSELVRRKRFEAAAHLCLEWVPRVREGLFYFHRYHRASLGLAVAALFATWILLLYTFIRWGAFLELAAFVPGRLCRALLCLEAALAFGQGWTLSHLVLFALPTYLATLVWTGQRLSASSAWAEARLSPARHLAAVLISGCLLFVFVTAFFHRAVVSVLLLFLAPFPHLTNSPHRRWCSVWAVCSLMLAIFPLLPVVGNVPMPALTVLAPLLTSCLLALCATRYCQTSRRTLLSLSALISLSAGLILLTETTGTCLLTRVFAWTSLVLALVLPLGAGPFLLDRLLVSLASTYLAYSLMSLAYESLFLLLFMVLLVAFVRLEHPALDEAQFKQLRVRGGQSSAGLLGLDAHSFGPFEPREWQRAAVLLVLVEVAFFGTGNLAALNGFNPSTIRNFVSTFSPFLMAALLVLKVALPFFLVAVAFVLVLDRQPEKVLRLGVLLMIITDVMAMVFFFCLKDEGSWLEIGMTISHYAICLSMSVVLFLLIRLARWTVNFHVDASKHAFATTDGSKPSALIS